MQKRRYMLMTARGRLRLYTEGDLCSNITDGWDDTLTHNSNRGTLTIEDDRIVLSNSSTGGYSNPRRASAVTQNKINTVGYKHLCMEFSVASIETNSTFHAMLFSSNDADDRNPLADASANVPTAADIRTICMLDLSSYQGTYNIAALWLKPANETYTYAAYLHRVWLE